MPDEQTWRFINTFAPWFSALGTLAAVITSLWLAARDRRIRLSVRAALTTSLYSGGGPGHGDRFVSVTVTNEGRRTATVPGPVLWRIGLPYCNFLGLKRIAFVWPHYEGAPLPAKLTDGDYAVINFPLEQFAGAMLNSMSKRSLFPCPYLRFKTMQVIVGTTAGRTFYSTITRELQKELIKRATAKWRPK